MEGAIGGFNLVGEILRATVDVLDLGGLQLALGFGGRLREASHPGGCPGLG